MIIFLKKPLGSGLIIRKGGILMGINGIKGHEGTIPH